MTLELLDRLSLAGDPAKANEDSFAVLGHAALVLDAATPLGPPLLPGQSDAHWIAQFGARRLAAHLGDGEAGLEALEHALADAEKSFAGLARAPIRETWQTPCAALIMVCGPLGPGPSLAEGLSALDFLWFGDCSALVEHQGLVEVIGNGLKSRREERRRAQRLAKDMNLDSALGVDQIAPLLRAARNRVNSGNNWLFSPDSRAIHHVARHTLETGIGARLLLASDGFLALVSDYGAYDAQSLMAAARDKGLGPLGLELRAIEEEDPNGRQFPRFKKSDDATALYVQLA